MKMGLALHRSPSGLLIAALLVLTGCAKFAATTYSGFGQDIGTFAREYTREAIARGKVTEALTQLDEWASEAETTNDWKNGSNFYIQASSAARLSGQLQKAVSYANKGLVMGEKARDPDLQARAILSLTRALGRLKQYAQLREWLKKGIESAKLIPVGGFRETIEASLYNQLGREFLRTGEVQEAIDHLLYAVQMRESLVSVLKRYSREWGRYIPANQEALINDIEGLGRAYQRAGRFNEAVATYERGLALIKVSGIQSYLDVYFYERLGNLYLNQKDYILAQQNLNRSLEMAEKNRLTEAVNAASRQMGDLLLQTRKSSEAILYYKKAIDSIESTRSLLTSEELRRSFFEDHLGAYHGMVLAQLNTRNLAEAFDYNERARSRAFLDILGGKAQLAHGKLLEEERELQARISTLRAMISGQVGDSSQTPELRKQFAEAQQDYNEFLTKVRKENKEQASLMNVEPLTLKQVQQRLDPEITMLEYFVTDTTVWLWVVEKDRLEFVGTSIARNNLVSKVNMLRDSIYQLATENRFNTVSQELYKLLIEPALPHIRGKELIVVPHDVLHYLPFQALLASDGQYLIEKYPIYYLSSASLMQFTQEKRRAGAQKVLAFDNPDLGDAKMSLQFAEMEAKQIQTIYPEAMVLLKREATEERAKTLSPQNGIIHFASHAELKEDDPLSSAILLAKSDKEDGRLEVREIFGMDLKASLIVLSACETGLGKLSSGDELVGLTRAFIYAGTPSVVASLWSVDDGSTAQLMSSFYRNLRTMTKAEALRQAQLQLIRGDINSELLARRGIGGVGKLGETLIPQSWSPEIGSPSPFVSDSIKVTTSHPYFWAPFILVGDGN